MAHPLSLERFLVFILVRNISPTLNATSAKNMLTQLFAEQREIFGVPNNIIIGLPVNHFNFENDLSNSLRAYVTYEDSNVHGRVAQFFNNSISFGRSLQMNHIFIDNISSPIFRARFIGRDYFDIEGDGGYERTMEVNGYECMVFSHLNYCINLTTSINDQNITSETIDEENEIEETNTLNENASNLPSTQETDYYSLPSSIANEIIQTNGNSFKCYRCLKSFGNNQTEFETHIEQCKINENSAMSFCVRQAKCTICQNNFLQSSTGNVRFLPCGHILHKECLAKLFEINYPNFECPNCRAEIPLGWTGKIILD